MCNPMWTINVTGLVPLPSKYSFQTNKLKNYKQNGLLIFKFPGISRQL